jgi:thioredoxin 1
MKKTSLFLYFAFLLCMAACAAGGGDGGYTNLAPKEFQAKIVALAEAAVLDVRTPEECQAGMIDKAQMADISGSGFEEKIKTLDKSKPVFVYCKAGGRSSKAAKRLKEAGFTEVYNLKDGISGWQNEGLPTVQKP